MKNVLDCPAVKDNVILPDGALRDHAAVEVQQVGCALIIAVVVAMNGVEAERLKKRHVVEGVAQHLARHNAEPLQLTRRLRA